MTRTRRPSPRRARRRRAASAADPDGRERILAAAIRSFSEIGYEGTTTAQVARDAGVTQPLVHHHFGSKEGLWCAAMASLFDGVHDIAGSPAEGSTRGGLVALTERFMRFVTTHPGVTRVMAREGATPGPRLTHLIDHYLREPFQRVVEAIRAAQRAGLIAPEIRPDLLLLLVTGAWSQLLDTSALAQEALGIDATGADTQRDFLVTIGALLEKGLGPGRPE